MGKPTYYLNDLPRFSPWPARLLGLDPWETKRKTPKEIIREFEYEKWGPLLKKVRAAGREVSIEEVDEWMLSHLPSPLCWIGDSLELISPMKAHNIQTNLVAELVESYLPASALVELGAGYGSIILSLAKRNSCLGMPIMAGEYTDSGLELIRNLSRAQGLNIQTAHCDFFSSQITDLDIPPGAIIFTSFAVCCVSQLSSDFVKAILTLQPKVVMHLEPCYEHCDSTTLLGLMRRRYIDINDYNTNLVTLLHEHQKQGSLTIVVEKPLVFGVNPLLTASVIVWSPTD
jgi:hypothetical protein